jgi:hypothetical protein
LNEKALQHILAVALIILLATISSAQASPADQIDVANTNNQSSVHPANHWKSDTIFTNNDAGTDVDIAFDPDHNQAAWVSYFNATYGSLFVAHYVGESGNCGPNLTWYCEQVDQEHAHTIGWFTSIDVYPDTNPSPYVSTWRVGVSY